MAIFFPKKFCYLFLLSISFTCFSISPTNSKCFSPFRWHVYICNGIPNSTISVHVKSGDDDLGLHNITYKNKYDFGFCENVMHNTIFWGDFSYGKRFVNFHVFDTKVGNLVGGSAFRENPINWLLKEDGYYITKTFKDFDDPAWTFMGHWSN